MDSIFDRVERNIDALVENDVNWSACATPEQLKQAREGKLALTFGVDGVVPAGCLGDLRGKRVLCLAGAGGLQAPLLACAGAEVTVLDLSERMLDKDRAVAAREGQANKLAYMEPLCTVPAYQKKGLAAAALSEMYRRTKALGATHMTGGTNPFYTKIGYEKVVEWTYWEKKKRIAEGCVLGLFEHVVGTASDAYARRYDEFQFLVVAVADAAGIKAHLLSVSD